MTCIVASGGPPAGPVSPGVAMGALPPRVRRGCSLDRPRALPVVHPSSRQQVISCGSAVEFAVVALAAAGYLTEVDVATDDGDPDHLATVRIVGRHQATD